MGSRAWRLQRRAWCLPATANQVRRAAVSLARCCGTRSGPTSRHELLVPMMSGHRCRCAERGYCAVVCCSVDEERPLIGSESEEDEEMQRQTRRTRIKCALPCRCWCCRPCCERRLRVLGQHPVTPPDVLVLSAQKERYQAERAETEEAARQLQGADDDPVGTRRLGEIYCTMHILFVTGVSVHGTVWSGGSLAATEHRHVRLAASPMLTHVLFVMSSTGLDKALLLDCLGARQAEQVPSYLWDMCRAKGSNGCLGVTLRSSFLMLILQRCNYPRAVGIPQGSHTDVPVRPIIERGLVNAWSAHDGSLGVRRCKLRRTGHRYGGTICSTVMGITLLCSLCCTRTKGMG